MGCLVPSSALQTLLAHGNFIVILLPGRGSLGKGSFCSLCCRNLRERSTAVCLLHPKVMYHQRTIVFLHKKRAKIIRSGERTCFTVYRHVRAFHTQDISESFAGLLYPFNLLISLHVSCYCLPQLAISSTSFQAPITAQGAAEAVFSHTGMLSVRGKAWTCSSWKGYGDGPREAKAKCTVLCNNSQLCCYN